MMSCLRRELGKIYYTVGVEEIFVNYIVNQNVID